MPCSSTRSVVAAALAGMFLAVGGAWAQDQKMMGLASPETQGSSSNNTDSASVLAKVREMQSMLETLEASLAAATACCNCSGGGGGGDKNGKGFSRPTTTRLDGPVSPFAAPTTTAGTTATATTSGAVRGAPALCAVFGDPHFITFDGGHTVLVRERAIWLVKTDSVWIQALSEDSDGKLMGLAVGGAFLKGHKVIVYNNTETKRLEVLFDGKPILTQKVDEFSEPGVLEATRDDEWDDERHDSQILDVRTEAKFTVSWKDRFVGEPAGGLVVLKLPVGVEVTATGVDFMSAVITMPRPEGGASRPSQGGYCGNFNGDPEDDALPVVPSWNVPIGEDLDAVKPSLNLFQGKSAPALLARAASVLSEERTPAKGRAGAPDDLKALLQVVANCPEDVKRLAREQCAHVQDARMERDCVFDVCLTRDVGAAKDAAATEVMEEAVNAKGIPVFMGHGRCAGKHGRTFDAFKTAARTEEQCREVLRSLALVKGVLGAQLHRTSACEVLVERGSDPTSTAIPGGWAGSTSSASPGQGLVEGIDERDAAWSCWQLD